MTLTRVTSTRHGYDRWMESRAAMRGAGTGTMSGTATGMTPMGTTTGGMQPVGAGQSSAMTRAAESFFSVTVKVAH